MSPKATSPATDPNALNPEDFATAKEYMIEKTRRELEERIPVQLPKDNENYKEPVSVCINGNITVIERGVPLMVKRGAADILAQSQHQLYAADKRSNDATSINMGDR